MKTIFVCAKCGSEEIQAKAWIYLNTEEVCSCCDIMNEQDDYWCEDCEEHCDIITKEEYELNN